MMDNKNDLLPMPWELWAAGIPKDIIARLFNYAKKNGYIKILIGFVWENDGCWRRGWLFYNHWVIVIWLSDYFEQKNVISKFWLYAFGGKGALFPPITWFLKKKKKSNDIPPKLTRPPFQ